MACTATWVTYGLSGLPALVELSFSLTAGHVDTHVLMTLAVFGTLAMGHAGEVNILNPPPYACARHDGQSHLESPPLQGFAATAPAMQ